MRTQTASLTLITHDRGTAQDVENPELAPVVFNYAREIRLTQFWLVASLAVWLGLSWETVGEMMLRLHAGRTGAVIEELVLIGIIQGLTYGNFVYMLTRIGYLRRRMAHVPASAEAKEALYDGNAPSLAVLVPSYKEELSVVRSTLLSAAFQDYPERRVVLLLDDPTFPRDLHDQHALELMRGLPHELQATFDRAAAPFLRAQQDFAAREAKGTVDAVLEAAVLAGLYTKAAIWVENFSASYPCADHSDALLHKEVFMRTARNHRNRAQQLQAEGHKLGTERLKREYNRLAALFSVRFSSFERKRYVNLSHESNKAMNLNSYIRLLGRSWREEEGENGLYLVEATEQNATLHVPAADFLITLDADSMLKPEYALVLVHEMMKPGNERMAVAQTPYNTIPNAPGLLERVSGATTDSQYINHQGLTHFGATYWVGANALLRVKALGDIRHDMEERGFDMPVFIHNRTVIEDTESTVDLIACGWSLYNYPERLAYSATPPDFGSLLIQRRRWANGGLIILPKLVRYLFTKPSIKKFKAGFFQVHYLISLALINFGILASFLHSFQGCIDRTWLVGLIIPWAVLYTRDLAYNGYRKRDLLYVTVLNIVLVPVNLGGVLKSLQQMVTGKRIPFSRTPKVVGRTGAPALYVALEYGLCLWMLVLAIVITPLHAASGIVCLFNAVALGFGIWRFIGFRESLEDMAAGLPRLKGFNRRGLKPAISAS